MFRCFCALKKLKPQAILLFRRKYNFCHKNKNNNSYSLLSQTPNHIEAQPDAHPMKATFGIYGCIASAVQCSVNISFVAVLIKFFV